MIVTAMMADTVCFKSSKAIPEEIAIAQQLVATYDLDWNLIKKHALCLTPIDKMSVSEIISNGEKQYNYNGSKVFSSYVQLEQLPDEQTLNDWLSALSILLSTQELTMSVFLLFDITANQTQEYQITQEQIRKFIHNRIVSRGKDIMPKIEKLFQQKMSIDEQNNNDIDI